ASAVVSLPPSHDGASSPRRRPSRAKRSANVCAGVARLGGCEPSGETRPTPTTAPPSDANATARRHAVHVVLAGITTSACRPSFPTNAVFSVVVVEVVPSGACVIVASTQWKTTPSPLHVAPASPTLPRRAASASGAVNV